MAKYDDNAYPGPASKAENEKLKIKTRRKVKAETDAFRRLSLFDLLALDDTSDY
jgi:hypothetical protein